jgi:NitT/TauT family transport system permease protein
MRRTGRAARVGLGALPFVAAGIAYAIASAARKAANPSDKLLPSPSDMAAEIATYAFAPDQRTGQYLLWSDTAESLARLAIGVGLAVALTLAFGIAIGFLPRVRATLAPFVAAISLVPPLALLPILFIAVGLGEAAKIVLIVIGITPIMIRDLSQHIAAIPVELVVKARTLGASTWQMILRLALPHALPRLVVTTRLALGPAWLFLIAAEAIASTGGLGYRIFLVRRYLAMDVIIPYVIWIALLAYAIDLALRLASRRAFRWAHKEGADL